ncbi:MAG TPA: hypothetical protein VNC78_06745 [Actinomycetota bacterium]|nr:hypothetical protein [Actinomycetota bacterium]
MAIKGKKKSQARGSQARRRPAAAPRVAAARRTHVPWYRTPGGRVGAAIGIAVIFGLIVGGVALSRRDDQANAALQEQMKTYTSDIERLVGELQDPVTELASMPTGVAGEEELQNLKDSVKKWRKALSDVQSVAFSLGPPPDTENANRLFLHAIGLYIGSVDTYELASQTEDVDVQSKIMGRAAFERGQANEAFLTAIAVLDEARDELDMTSSGLEAPGAAPAPAPEETSITLPPAETPGAQIGTETNQDGGDKPKKGKN